MPEDRGEYVDKMSNVDEPSNDDTPYADKPIRRTSGPTAVLVDLSYVVRGNPDELGLVTDLGSSVKNCETETEHDGKSAKNQCSPQYEEQSDGNKKP